MDDDDWFLDDAEQPHDQVDSQDLPWFGEPWPPYLPMPDGSWVGITRANIMLCTPLGWRWVAARVFDLCERVAAVEILALSQHRGRLLMRVGMRETLVDDGDWASGHQGFALSKLEGAIERLCDETLHMCEVCGGPVNIPAHVPRTRTLCGSHIDGKPITEDDDLPW
jgi:hypothetical protein